MLKSYVQQRIEAQHEGKEFREVLIEVLTKHKGTGTLLVAHVCLEMKVSATTLHNWCRDLGIDLAQYRNEVPTGVPE